MSRFATASDAIRLLLAALVLTAFAHPAQALEFETRLSNADNLFNTALERAEAGDLGESILALERARVVSPGDRGVEDTLLLAQREARRRRAEAAGKAVIVEGEPPAVAWWRAARRMRLLNAQSLTLAFVWLAFGGWLLRRRLPQSGRRDAALVVAVLSSGVALIGLMLVVGNAWTAVTVRPAIVLSEEPTWRESPDELQRARRSTELFEGAVVLVRERRTDWTKIEIVSGNTGWVRRGTVECIEDCP
jgi:hypothetical protein